MSIKFEGVEQFEIGLKKAVDSWEIKAINALNSVLAEMANYAKTNGPWGDKTSNLRNSIGYVPAFFWKAEDCQSTTRTISGIDKKGRPYQAEETRLSANGKDSGDVITGILYAGMEYAIYVELTPGYWVISGAFSEYKNKIAKMISDAIKAQND